MKRVPPATTKVIVVAMALYLAGCTLSEERMRELKAQSDPTTTTSYPKLENDLFGRRTILTGILQPKRFLQAIGFWIFPLSPSHPKRPTVVLVHGHSTGPRPFAELADDLIRNGFDTWMAFYPAGLSLEETARLFRDSLSREMSRQGKRSVAVVGYSLGGLVVRQALRPTGGEKHLPHIPLFVGIANPWNGVDVTHRFFDIDMNRLPPSWADFTGKTPFLKRLFSEPLPEDTVFHAIYGVGGNSDRLPGRDDGMLSETTMARPAAMREASTKLVLPEATHGSVISDAQARKYILSLLRNMAVDRVQPQT